MAEIEGVEMDFLRNRSYLDDVERACRSVPENNKLYGKSIFISGASGLMGSFLTDMVRFWNEQDNAGISLWLLSRDKNRLRSRFGEECEWKHYVEGDICSEFAFGEPIDFWLHAAANSYPALFCNEPVDTLMKSVCGTKNMLSLALKCGAERFLMVSSGEIYGQYNSSNDVHRERDHGTVDILSVRSCYPLGKQAAENLCVCFQEQYHLPVVIARPCHSFGPNALLSDNRAHMQFLRNAVNAENIVLKSAGLQRRSYLYIADCASALFAVLLKGEVGNAYNICGDESMSIRQFAEECAASVERKVLFQDETAGNTKGQTPIQTQILCGDKLRNIGWEPSFSIREGIEHSINIMSEVIM